MFVKRLKYFLRCLFTISPQLPDKVIVMRGTYISEDSRIGKYTYIGYNVFISRSEVGRFCSIANNVSIGNGEHDISDVSTSSLFYDSPYQRLTSKPCTIGNDVWIGVNSVIRRGIKVGNGAVIGANSFVNKDVPPFAVVGGVPAKVLKFRFDKRSIEIIETFGWWNYDVKEAKSIIADIENRLQMNNKEDTH